MTITKHLLSPSDLQAEINRRLAAIGCPEHTVALPIPVLRPIFGRNWQVEVCGPLENSAAVIRLLQLVGRQYDCRFDDPPFDTGPGDNPVHPNSGKEALNGTYGNRPLLHTSRR